MPWFLTDYRANWRAQEKDEGVASPGKYGAHLWATSFENAKKVAKLRGLGETVISTGFAKAPYEPASNVLNSRQNDRAKIHSLCFLGMIALASGAATAQEIVGDEGIIHMACHPGRSTKELVARTREIERKTPGYWPQNKRAAKK